MKVVVTETGLADLIEIGRHIKTRNPARSITFVDELYDGCQRIGIMPYAYPLLPNHEERGIRRRVEGGYLIFYRIVGDGIEILHGLHGARDYESVLFPDE